MNSLFSLQLFAQEGDDTGRKAALYDAFAPSLQTLADRYGIAPEPEALADALQQEQQAQLQQRQTQADRLYDAWMEQAEQTRQAYPDFDLAKALNDPRFLGMLRAQVDVCTAYEALNRPAAMARMEQSVMDRLAATGARPRENGTSAQGAAVTRQDVSRMSKADRQEIIRRVQRGEKISF